MEFRSYIERAEKAAGSQKELGLMIGQSAGKLRQAKANKCGLPIAVCCQIAQLIGVDEMEVISASELVTEKKPERRAVLLPFVNRVAGVILGIVGIVTLNMSPAPAQASEFKAAQPDTVYYVKSVVYLQACADRPRSSH